MLDRLSENAVLTKALAMYGNRLKPEDYAELMRKRTVGEVAAYLKSLPGYADALKTLNESSVHRARLEMLLQREMFEKYARLSRYDISENGSFFKYIVRCGEVDEILRLLLFLNAGDPEGFIAEIPSFLVRHASFDLMRLAEVKRFSELPEVLSGTPYAAILRAQGVGSAERVDYTACEIALYTFIYTDQISAIKKQRRAKSKKALLELLEADVELKNISTIYRARLLFHKTPAETDRLLFPVFSRLRAARREQLVEAEDADAFARQLQSTYYGRYFEREDLRDIDRFAQRVKYRLHKQAIRFSDDPSCVLYAFVTLGWIEQYNLTNIIEGIRYGVSVADLQKLLITDSR